MVLAKITPTLLVDANIEFLKKHKILLKSSIWVKNMILATSLIFLVIGILCLFLPNPIKKYFNKGSLNSEDTGTQIYFILVRFFGIVAIILSGYMFYKIII